MKRELYKHGISIEVPPNWCELENQVDSKASGPLTITNSVRGVGAMQISVASYSSGLLPQIFVEDLEAMVKEFGEKHNLGEPLETEVRTKPNLSAGRSYHEGNDFIKAWYVSDGANVAFVTYVVLWRKRGIEMQICNQIVSSLRFVPKQKRKRG